MSQHQAPDRHTQLNGRADAPSIANGTRATLHGIAVTHLRSSDGATATIADHGAHVLSWCPAGGVEALYLSPTSCYGARDAIRGGVPVIFPQFGEQGPGKRHGFARIRRWALQSASIEEGAAVARLTLQGRLDDGPSAQVAQGAQNEEGSKAAEFRLLLEVRLQGATLQLGLTIENTGLAAWSCQAALHTYLRVAALETARIEGLQGCAYIDQTAASAVSLQTKTTLDFATEVDRVYPDAPSSLLLSNGSHQLGIAQQGFADTVVWNPGAVKAAALTDLPQKGYRDFVCIEAAAIARRLALAPGERWHAIQRLSVLPRVD